MANVPARISGTSRMAMSAICFCRRLRNFIMAIIGHSNTP
nr:MAG TPA: hypothetical protein [Caudoviricetes sp.]